MDNDFYGWQAESPNYYNDFCLRASVDDQVFKSFRSNKTYQKITAFNCEIVSQPYRSWLANRPEVGIMDLDYFGGPSLLKNGKSFCSLRYSVTTQVMEDYGLLRDGMKICEIGGGWGGQALAISKKYKVDRYRIYDLFGPSQLQKKILDEYADNIKEAECGTLAYHDDCEKYDLVISNYALSELDTEFVKVYADKVISRADTGYFEMTLQRGNPKCPQVPQMKQILTDVFGDKAQFYPNQFTIPRYNDCTFVAVCK
jgi:hypothetical protein